MSTRLEAFREAGPRVVPGDLPGFDEPEKVVIHMEYVDPEVCMAWGVVPGTALCGFIFTTANDCGPKAAVLGDPRFVVEDCHACKAVAADHWAQWIAGMWGEGQ